MSYPIISSTVTWKLESYKKTPNFSSVLQKTAASRSNAGISLKPLCTWDFDVELPVNQSSILATSSIISKFIGCFAACNGQASLFLYSDATDNAVTTGVSGMLDVTSASASPMAPTGNGTSTAFQLVRSLGGVAWDLIQNVNGTINVYVNGTLKTLGTDYSVSSTGVVTFVSAPANGAVLTWSGNFYFLCRFGADSFTDLSMIGYNASGPLWTCSGIKYSSEFI